jgi:hypothetical protein
LDVAGGKVLQGVERSSELEVTQDFKMPCFACDEVVAADAMFACVDAGQKLFMSMPFLSELTKESHSKRWA